MTPSFDLTAWDVILVNSSAGKDSQAMLTTIVGMAEAQGVKDRIVVVHCDLGRVEWQGTRDLAERQAAHYGLRFEVVSRPQGDLLDHVAARRLWPSSSARYCTSDHKRGQVRVLMTRLVRELGLGRAARILNCMGLRADESPARAKRQAFERDNGASNSKREVWTWLPIHGWSEAQVWQTIRQSGVEHHYAYDLGMPRLSCCFCIFAPENALLLAGKHNRPLLAQYVQVEAQIGHCFTQRFSLAQVQARLDAGAQPGPVREWALCA
jgi:3'-phosphoadenosine 5'-phosphosulfate sulfotransferase (PAPS reductase)/FAD synthetase